MRRYLDAPLVVALLIAAVYSIFTLSLLRARGMDVSRFVVAGGAGVDPGRIPRGLTVTDSGGYDGMAFYRLALDPFTRVVTDFGISLDNPPYRQQRIGYPLIVWALSGGGQPQVALWMMVIVNVIAVSLLAWAAAAWAVRMEAHPAWGLVAAFYPGFALSISRDLSEVLACAILMCGILALRAGRSSAAAALISFALLTRETVLFVPIALAAAWAWDRIRRRAPRFAAGAFAWPLSVYTAWQLLLWRQWGTAPIRAGAPETVKPFSLWFEYFADQLPRKIHQQRVNFSEIAFWFAMVVLVVVVLLFRHRLVAVEWKLSWLAYLALAAIVPETIWYEDFGYMRVFADLFLVGVLALIGARVRGVLWPLLITTAWVWYYVADNIVLAR